MKRFSYLFALLAVLVLAFAIQPAAAQQNVIWRAQYYNNAYLIGLPKVERTETAINFDWGMGSPDPGISPNTFSARFGTDTHFDTVTYRFTVIVDDEVRVTIGDRVIINTLDAPRVGETLTADVAMTAGTHHVQIDYRERTGNAYLKLSWYNLSTSPPANPTGAWTAEYFTNSGLAGSPVAILSESSPSHNWGLGSPLPSIPADNWSARWRTTQYLDAGTYQLRVAADDGVRVFVDGIAYINEWHLATGMIYTATFTLGAGNHSFVVEYYEAGFNAFLEYSLHRLDAPSIPVGGSNATVTAAVLNVRNAPSTVTGAIITKIRRGETYPVTGRNGDATWYRLNVNGTAGWVSRLYVNVSNAAGVPVVDTSPISVPVTPAPTGYQVVALNNVNLRGGPGTSNGILAVIPRGGQAELIGRNAQTNWLQVRYNGVVGWVNYPYVQATTPINFGHVPITG
jgi:uncharacterized protein YraI